MAASVIIAGYWVNANKWNDKPAIICFFLGKAASRLRQSENHNKVIEEIRATLQEMFPDTVVPPPVDTYITNWKQDPFSNGSYSYISVNEKYEDRSYLTAPIANRLLFAGEATSSDTYGFAHGALLSGRREATRLLYVYDLLPKQNTTTS